jgi:AcrR family transcriptional regulator
MARKRRSQSGSAEVVVRRGVLNQARWEQILQSAADEFYEKGFKAARLQDIAARVGLLTGSLYYYIESKDDLLFALVEVAYRKRLDTLVEDEDVAAKSAPKRLETFIQRQMRVLEDTQSTSIQVVDRDRKYLSPEHQAQVDSMTLQLHTFVTGILEQGVAEGDFEPVDTTIATNTLFQLLNTTTDWARKNDQSSWTHIGDWYTQLFLSALSPKAPAPSPD